MQSRPPTEGDAPPRSSAPAPQRNEDITDVLLVNPFKAISRIVAAFGFAIVVLIALGSGGFFSIWFGPAAIGRQPPGSPVAMSPGIAAAPVASPVAPSISRGGFGATGAASTAGG